MKRQGDRGKIYHSTFFITNILLKLQLQHDEHRSTYGKWWDGMVQKQSCYRSQIVYWILEHKCNVSDSHITQTQVEFISVMVQKLNIWLITHYKLHRQVLFGNKKGLIMGLIRLNYKYIIHQPLYYYIFTYAVYSCHGDNFIIKNSQAPKNLSCRQQIQPKR